MKTYARVWSLWSSIEDMAVDLDIAVNDLKVLRQRGTVPGPLHDRLIVARGIYMNKPVTEADLIEARGLHRRQREIDDQKTARMNMIEDFFEFAGGVSAVARKAGTTENALRICKVRGSLTRKLKHEFLTIAASARFNLPDEIFVPLK